MKINPILPTFSFDSVFGMIVILIVMGCKPSNEVVTEELESAFISIETTDSVLAAAFNWARDAALALASDEDPVGPWYEAALPGRDAFCMRDVSHQSVGAAALGLNRHNHNMLLQFARGISGKRDWCSFWEINKWGDPAPVDYESDSDFWYNLPANFDIVFACYRQFLWTGDSTYLVDPAFQNFYQRTLYDYAEHWQLMPPAVFTRYRHMHRDTTVPGRFGSARGIPGYNEGGRGVMRLGIDLLAAQYAALNAGLILRPEQSDLLKERSREIIRTIQARFWDPERERFRTILYEDGTWDYDLLHEGQEFQQYLLHFGVPATPEQIQQVVRQAEEHGSQLIVELASHLPAILYEYHTALSATELLKYMSQPDYPRRDYPENAFAIVEAVVTGLMGVSPDGGNQRLRTIARLPEAGVVVTVSDLSVLGGKVNISHQGMTKTTLTNNLEAEVTWRACFSTRTSRILSDVTGEIPAMLIADRAARVMYCADISLDAGQSATCWIPSSSE